MKKFFLSQLYANFWKFSLFGALISAALSVFNMLLIVLTAEGGTYHSIDGAIMIFGGFGLVVGFPLAAVGFWIVYTLAKMKSKMSFDRLSLVTGTFLAFLVLFYFIMQDSTQVTQFFLFLTIPVLGSIYFFHRLSKKYIEPVLFEL